MQHKLFVLNSFFAIHANVFQKKYLGVDFEQCWVNLAMASQWVDSTASEIYKNFRKESRKTEKYKFIECIIHFWLDKMTL